MGTVYSLGKKTSPARSARAASDEDSATLFITGTAESENRMTSAGEQDVKAAKKVVFGDSTECPDGPYPCTFKMNDKQYILFTRNPGNQGNFLFYEVESETDTELKYTSSTDFDFAAINAYFDSKQQPGEEYYTKGNYGYRFSAPEFNVARKTLYFTAQRWRDDERYTPTGWTCEILIFESKLGNDGITFETPSMVKGELNPYDASHFTDNVAHTYKDFDPNGNAYNPWINRLRVSGDGKKAYFTIMNPGYDCTPLKTDSFLRGPVQPYREYELDDDADYRCFLIQSFICSADITDDGSFVNAEILGESVNLLGINAVASISEDGSTLFVDHMTLDKDFWAKGVGAENMLLDITNGPANLNRHWKGYVTKYSLVNNKWEPEENITATYE